MKQIVVREAIKRDHALIFELSPNLAEVAELPWHSEHSIQQMQDKYIAEMLVKTSLPNITFIAELNGVFLGFIHVRTRLDSISDESIGTVPLLAVSPKAQGMGVGKKLIQCAEVWSKEQGCRLLHLEVFASNKKAQGFYENVGFIPETTHMIKPI